MRWLGSWALVGPTQKLNPYLFIANEMDQGKSLNVNLKLMNSGTSNLEGKILDSNRHEISMGKYSFGLGV